MPTVIRVPSIIQSGELLTLYACGYVYPLKIMATLAKQNSGS